MVFARKLNQLRIRDMLCHVASMPHIDHALRGTMQNESWYADGGQNIPYIDFAVHPQDRTCCARACRRAVIRRNALGSMSVTGKARRAHCNAQRLRRSPMLLDVIEHGLPLLVLPTVWVIGSPGTFGIGSIQHECGSAFRISGGVKAGTSGRLRKCRIRPPAWSRRRPEWLAHRA